MSWMHLEGARKPASTCRLKRIARELSFLSGLGQPRWPRRAILSSSTTTTSSSITSTSTSTISLEMKCVRVCWCQAGAKRL